MLLIHCPYCKETLPESEFTYAGQAHIVRPEMPSEQTDAQWEEFLFLRANPKGPHYERWRHFHGCGRFFNAVRDTVSDKFLTTYPANTPKPDLESLIGDAE
ncbi:sarcosine oxidase subunit delta [Cognatishimia maritima]|uniref:Sarcosine oxidase subunit delta n=1 Tax=Cognatishimia maritima TaxID=870908 RepID=A0A1M5L8Z9_9RHOB|nr:sarcosine oxidase subunit delta [Cognatishimia maritima]SHG61594.1 sarcosine oxidase subunit delta [Cognatishimia maritima]